MKIFVLVCHDRHCDDQIELYEDDAKAIERAESLVAEYGDGELHDDQPLSNDMKRSGWIYYRVYSCEGDHVRIEMKEIKK